MRKGVLPVIDRVDELCEVCKDLGMLMEMEVADYLRKDQDINFLLIFSMFRIQGKKIITMEDIRRIKR